MKSTIYLLLFGLLLSTSVCGQDSTDFKPNWSIGTEKGYAQISGDLNSASGIGLGLYGEKHFLPYLSLRVQLGMGQMLGLDSDTSNNWMNHPVWNGSQNAVINYNNSPNSYIYRNYKTQYQEANLQVVFRFTELLNNQSPFKAFLLAGIGGMFHQTFIDAVDAEGNIYDFSEVLTLGGEAKRQKQSDLQAVLDGNYETAVYDNPKLSLQYHLALGVEWKLSDALGISLMHRVGSLNSKDFDTYLWDENNQLHNKNDWQQYTALSLNYTFGKTTKIEVPQVIEVDTTEEFVKVKDSLNNPQDSVIVIEEPDPDPEPEPDSIHLNKEETEILQQAFDNLEFETGKSVIKSSSYASLDELAELLKAHEDWRLEIKGHTDNVGNADNNMKLSQQRAEAVRDYIAAKGISKDRFVVAWFGETQPIADNNTSEGRQKNRRVELKIVN